MRALIALVLFTSCGLQVRPEPGALSAAASPARTLGMVGGDPAPFSAVATPPSHEGLLDRARDTARRLGVAPVATSATAPTFPEPGPDVVAMTWLLDPSDPAPRQMRAFDMLFTVAPHAVLNEEGELEVRWQTREPTPRGVVYLGLRVEEDPLAAPRHRREFAEALDGAARAHRVVAPVRSVLKPAYDVNRVLERGYGEVAWRVEAYDPQGGSTVSFDGRTAFRLDGPRFVQLPTITVGPSVHRLDADTWVLRVETDVPTAAAARIDSLDVVTSDAASMQHELVFVGLTSLPSAAHTATVAVSNGVESSLAPSRSFQRYVGGPLRVAIASDSRSGVAPGLESYGGVNATVLHSLFTRAAREGIHAIFFPGDLIDGYVTEPEVYDWQLRHWLQVTEPVGGAVPIYTGMGNHEALVHLWSDRRMLYRAGAESAEERFAAMMVNPRSSYPPARPGEPSYAETVYGVDLGEVHFAMLNTNYAYARYRRGEVEGSVERYGGLGNREGSLRPEQLAWLDSDLQAARDRGAKHLIVMGHEPAFPAGGHKHDAMWWHGEIEEVNAMRESFWRILGKYGVLAYVSGDEHNYSRALIGDETVPGAQASVWSIISGGCGAPYYAKDVPEAYAERLHTFSAQQHITLWTFDGDRVVLEVIGITGGLIERVELVGAREASVER